MFFRWLVGLLFSLFLCGFSFAEFTVSGTVKDETGETLPGASVLCAGTNNGDETNINGYFSFKSKKLTCSIRVSFVGYKPYTGPKINSQQTLSIILQEENNTLDEVTVSVLTEKNCKKRQGPRTFIKGKTAQENKCICKGIDSSKTNDKGDKEYSCTPKETPPPKDPDPVEKNANDATHVDHGLKCDLTRVMYGSCGMNIYNVLNIRQSDTETTATEFVQDFVLTATTFIGTVLTFALVVSGLMIIFGGANENTASRGRQGIKYALIGYVIVLCSYTVIRLVQYLAAG